MGSDVSKGIDSAISIVTGIITGDITGGLAGASAPWVAEQIKKHTGHKDENGNWKTDDVAGNLIAHAILGAVVAELQGNSGLAGGAGAVTGELAADIIRKQLYGKDVKDLTEAEKENISALAQLATGLAVASVGGDVGDVSTGIAAGKNAVENNASAVPKAPGPLGLIEMLLRPSELGSGMLPVAVTTPQLVAETALISSLDLTEEEVKQYLNSLPSDTLSGLVVYRPEMTDDEYNASFSQAVIDLYNQTQNVISSNETSNGDKDKSQASASTQTGSGTVSGGASLPPDDDDNNKKSKTHDNSQTSKNDSEFQNKIDKSWDKGSFDSPEGSLDYHFNKHGKEVGAENIKQNLRKATEFAKNLRGARTVKLNNPTPGVIRYYKNGKYLDKLGDKIISFGKQ